MSSLIQTGSPVQPPFVVIVVVSFSVEGEFENFTDLALEDGFDRFFFPSMTLVDGVLIPAPLSRNWPTWRS